MENDVVLSVINDKYIFHNSEDDEGYYVIIMERTGLAVARVYQYKDDLSSIYLDSLSVNNVIRNHGIGTELQEIREKIGILSGATRSFLAVKIDSWMHEWYKRRGYTNYQKHNDPQLIWMYKIL